MAEPRGCLELLSLLLPSSRVPDNIAATSVPKAHEVVIPGRPMKKDELAAYREVKKFRRDSVSGSGSRSGRAEPVICREDVLVALSGCSDLEELFVYALLGMLREDSILLFESEAHKYRLEGEELFAGISLNDFRPVWRVAWRAYFSNRVNVSVNALAGFLGCSRSKARGLMPVFSRSLQVVFSLEADVCCLLRKRLRSAAA